MKKGINVEYNYHEDCYDIEKKKGILDLDEMKYNHYMMAFNRNYDHKTGNLAFLTGISKHLGWEFEYE